VEDRPSLLPRLSVSRPVTVTMILVALMVVGAVAYVRIPVKLMPSGFTPPFMYVRVGYPGTTPQEVEQQIARPLEELLRTVKGIDNIRSYSGTWGVSFPLRFQQDADMDLAYNQLIDRLERLKPELPDEARDNIFIWKRNDEQMPLLWVGVAIDSSIVDPYRFMETHIQRRLERIDGVANVELWGVDQKEVMIEIDRERLQARGVSTYELVRSLQSDNFSRTGGHVREAGKKLYVRSVARYQDLEEIENIPISARSGDVRLREVADVVFGAPEKRGHERTDGVPSASFSVRGESGSDIVLLCDRVIDELHNIESDSRSDRLAFNVFFNQGQFIRESIENLRNTGLWGGLFAAGVLFFFLRGIRMTAIITLALPVCMMITIGVFYFIGWSLNLLTMMGLMVGVGMVVDNAIVILENIYRKREEGLEPRAASVQGASEVSTAITMATLTTVVVFLPIILMSGNVGMTFFLSRLGVPVISLLMGSLFVALVFIPLGAMRFGGEGVKTDPGSVGWARRQHRRMLTWVLLHRRDAILLVVVALATIVIPSSGMKRADSSHGNINDIRINVYPPRYLSLAETDDVMSELERALEEKRERYGIRTMRTWFRYGRGEIQAFLEPDSESAWWGAAYRGLRSALGVPVDGRMARSEVIQDLKKHLPRFVDVRTTVEGSGGSSQDPSVSVYLYGDDTEQLGGMVEEVERRLRTIPSVVSVKSDLERADDEVRVRIDREKALRYGISSQTVGRTLAFSLQGVSLPRYQSPQQQEVDTRLYLNKADRKTLQQLKGFTFRSTSGGEIPLSEFASLKVTKGSGTIRREDGKTRILVSAYTTKEDLKGLFVEVDRAMEGFHMPRGYSWNKGERYDKFQEDNEALMFAVIMAVTCVFLLMGVLFESFILPFSVLFSIPFAFLGVYWTLYLTGTPMDMMANIGVIVLIGVVVNNAIVLVDMINRMRQEGLDRHEAILEAGRNRFRPILMTTLTTVFGLLPMSVGNSSLIGIPYAPLGRTMMGGLLCSTFLTLLVVPLFYTFLDDLRVTVQRLATAAFQRRSPMPAEGTADD
jgi:hydrophobic/amphiphilic exporter-1 (mainly G- bacteria), HAE1 family